MLVVVDQQRNFSSGNKTMDTLTQLKAMERDAQRAYSSGTGTRESAADASRAVVRCNLSQAAAPVEVDYCTGDGWESTRYQCADARHTTSGLVEIGEILAAQAVEMSNDNFACEIEEVE